MPAKPESVGDSMPIDEVEHDDIAEPADGATDRRFGTSLRGLVEFSADRVLLLRSAQGIFVIGPEEFLNENSLAAIGTGRGGNYCRRSSGDSPAQLPRAMRTAAGAWQLVDFREREFVPHNLMLCPLRMRSNQI
jgi:hypothetical protein